MVAMHVLNRTIRLRYLYMALPLMLMSIPAYSQTFCQRLGNSVVCDGENGSRAIQPLGRNGAIITDERGNNSYYSNGMILESESRSYRDAQRRSEERRREMIYGDDRRDRNRDRDEER